MGTDRLIVVCGLGRMGTRVLEYLQAAGFAVVVVDTVCGPNDPRLRGARLVHGDARQLAVLEEAGVRAAHGVLILTRDDLVNISTALAVRSLNPQVRIVLRMFNQNLLARLGQAVRNVFALSTSLLTAPTLALLAVTGQGLATFRVGGPDASLQQIVELAVTPESELRGRAIGTVVANRGLVPLGHRPAGGDDRFLLDVDLDTRLNPGDRLVLCGDTRSLAPLLTSTQGSTSDLRWGTWLGRTRRVLRRTVAELDRAVLVCSAVVLAVVLISTVVLHLGVTRYSVPTALLRTVSILATAASLHDDEIADAPGIQVFVSILRVVGAVLMATFTAIVTNYLLRARLGGALEVRRIPERGHVIVCGLSTIGLRLVEELIAMRQRVVVIECNANNRFIGTSRRLGAAVLIGDAGVNEVLRQANARNARAVISTVNNDMTNLEVALLVRELNPSQRVVLLIDDPQFAQMLRDAADVRLAISVPAVAAPAFIAGLYGDRVASVFLLQERLHAVLDLLINPNDPFAGHSVRAMAVDYRLVPLQLVHADGSSPPLRMGERLSAGDRLVGVLALADLDRLLRRQPSSAGWAVEVEAFPLPTRGWLASLLRTTAGVGADEAEAALDRLPLRLATNLTRGQAEDLMAQLVRERVKAHISDSVTADDPA